MIFVNEVEAVWLALNLTTLVVITLGLLDARRDQSAMRAGNGPARTLVARGNVRREGLRLLVQMLLAGAVVPNLFVDNPANVTPAVVMLIGASVVLLVASLADTRERSQLARLTEAAILAERTRVQLADLDKRIDRQDSRTTDEMQRTDEHQVVQDDRLDVVEDSGTR